jgi:hypothetical protein
MSYNLDDPVWRVIALYDTVKRSLPKPRAFALRLLEEAVELALACGASPKDAFASFHAALVHEQLKDPERDYAAERINGAEAIAAEIADVCLLAAATAAVADITDDKVEAAAIVKVERLNKAAVEGTLDFAPDGRFYRTPH